jgi:hypothetical protein
VTGKGIDPNEENEAIFGGLIEDLENIELSGLAIPISNCFERVNARVRLGLGSDRETQFIASHLSELTIAAIPVLAIGIMNEIVGLE